MYYYRESTKDNYEDDIRNLNNKIDIVYRELFIRKYYSR